MMQHRDTFISFIKWINHAIKL